MGFGDAVGMREPTGEATAIAKRLGPATVLRDHGGGFSPTTVQLHLVSAASSAAPATTPMSPPPSLAAIAGTSASARVGVLTPATCMQGQGPRAVDRAHDQLEHPCRRPRQPCGLQLNGETSSLATPDI
ncbi:hypothetical protein GCM10010507_19560 [Streptomyces cinnamoneus]|uniref:Uncharacterized protein n=1 Tax=Streptomyces cinnamoneus TaxID=53446 RepID=A0A918TFJ5_STRCJ|nr:hypothetical protein GCM10010507_19560 [Streptomyces cinnamoneus]